MCWADEENFGDSWEEIGCFKALYKDDRVPTVPCVGVDSFKDPCADGEDSIDP